MKKYCLLFTLSMLFAFGVNAWLVAGLRPQQKSLPGLSLRPMLYPYVVDPSEYPEDRRRPHQALTWGDFENKTQFVAGRNLPKSKEEESHVVGKVYRAYLGSINYPDLEERLRYMKKRGFFLHNLGGYGPGSRSINGGFGELMVGDKPVKLLEKYMDRRFTGFDIGEQDGRFNFTYRIYLEPYKYNRVEQYIQSQPYFDRIGSDLKHWCSNLTVLWYWNYILKEGNCLLAGAETQNKITNGQVQYMHLRGAGKQYGVLWYGDVSVFGTWGTKLYNPNERELASQGASLSLMKRSYYTQYMYNSTILSMETGWYVGPWNTTRGTLSPIGKMHTDCHDFVEKYGQPGVMTTQVALLNDFYSGWMPADHIANRFVVWNGMNYEKGDYLTDAIYSMIYPYYEKSGFFYNETGAMVNTPYGENFDAILTDSRLETMMQYPLMVAVGDLFSGGMELSDKITQYVENGGTFVATARNAARLWPQWQIGRRKYRSTSDKMLDTCLGKVAEKGDFDIYEAELPSDATVLARVNDHPVAVSVPLGKGKVVLSLTDYGLVTTPEKYVAPPKWGPDGWNKFLPRPYVMMEHLRLILDDLFSSLQLFTVGDDLGCIINRLDKNKYRIAIYNNGLKSRPFRITSKIGNIKHMEELPTGRKLFGEEGYWPNKNMGDENGKDDSSHIYGGDIRIFDVVLEEEHVTILPKIKQPKPVKNVLLARNDIMYTKESIRRMPTFFDHFDGIAVEAQHLLAADDDMLEKDNEWFELQSLHFVADFRKGFEEGRWSFDKQSRNYQKTIEEVNNTLRKLGLISVDRVALFPASCGKLPREISRCKVLRTDGLRRSRCMKAGGYTVVDSSSNDWNTIYGMLVGNVGNTPEIAGRVAGLQGKKTIIQNESHMLALDRYTTNIVNSIDSIKCFFDVFGGVCVPAAYLANQSLEALQKEKKELDVARVSMVVSFIEEINHFPGLTLCNAVEPYYRKSMAYYKSVLDKMGALGIRTAIFTTQPDVEANYPKEEVCKAMRKTFSELAIYAQAKGITLSISNTRFRMESTTEEQVRMLADVHQPNMALTVNMNHLAKDKVMQAVATAGNLLNSVIIGAPANTFNSQYMSISQAGGGIDYMKGLDKGVLQIICNPEVSNQAIEADCRCMGWLKKND